MSLFENVVAMALIRRYGSREAVFYYKNGIEVDFYLPDADMAVQACYDFADSEDTRKREIRALVKLNQRFPCQRNIIVTYDHDEVVAENGINIDVVSLRRFLLSQCAIDI